MPVNELVESSLHTVSESPSPPLDWLSHNTATAWWLCSQSDIILSAPYAWGCRP